MKMTVKELAAAANVQPNVANGVLRFLAARGVATLAGQVAKPTKTKGRRESLFDVSDAVAAALGVSVAHVEAPAPAPEPEPAPVTAETAAPAPVEA